MSIRALSIVEKEDVAHPATMDRRRWSGRQTAFKNIELAILGAKSGYLKFLTNAGLDRIPMMK